MPPEELPTPMSRCASSITNCRLPDWGPKQRTLPSLHPLMICLPLVGKAMQLHTRLGTWRRSNPAISRYIPAISLGYISAISRPYLRAWMRSSSDEVFACHTRMSAEEQVAKRSE